MRHDLTRLTLGPDGQGGRSRLIFGTPRNIRSARNSREVAVFGPGDVFGFETVSGKAPAGPARFAGIVKCDRPGSELSRIRRVEPGGILLLSAIGKHHAARALDAIEQVGKLRDPETVPATFWQRLSTQLQAGLPVEDLLQRQVW